MLGFSTLSQAPLSSLGGRSAQVTLPSDSAAFALSAPSIIGKATVTLPSDSASLTTGTLSIDAAGNVTLTSALGTFSAGTLEANLAKRIFLTGTPASFTLTNVTPKGNATGVISAVRELSAIGRVNLSTPTALSFEFDPAVYDRSRTIILSPFKTDNYTVHIQAVQPTLYMRARNENYTVHIQPESYTVYIEGHADDRTVYVI